MRFILLSPFFAFTLLLINDCVKKCIIGGTTTSYPCSRSQRVMFACP